MTMAAKIIFISYRREDSAGYAGRIRDWLLKGGSNVFMDVDSIKLGWNFVDALAEEVAKCSALLAVIGRNWLEARDDKGSRRLDNPKDFVRVEIAAALQRKIPVIPILVDGATVPSADQLPNDLQELSFRAGLNVRHDSFENDMDRLIRGLKDQLPGRNWRNMTASSVLRRPGGWLTRRGLLAATGTTGAAVALGGLAYKSWKQDSAVDTPAPGKPAVDTGPKEVSIADIAAKQGPVEAITTIAARSQMPGLIWPGRGRAPSGYNKGMALVYARVHLKYKAGSPAAKEMAKANTGDWDNDALQFYSSEFVRAGMSNTLSGPATLRHLFVLLIGLGIRESSGRYCESFDRSANDVTAESAEGGLFQTTFQIMSASPLLPELFSYYLAHPSGFADVFGEGISCRAKDKESLGDGDGLKFQRLSKQCPAFAVEVAAVGLRYTCQFWGPIKRKEVEIRPECNEMLRQVQDFVDGQPNMTVATLE